jgi:hypothetical protein
VGPDLHQWQVRALYALAILFAGMLVYGLLTGETPGRSPFSRVEEPRQYWQSLSLLFMLSIVCLLGGRWMARR